MPASPLANDPSPTATTLPATGTPTRPAHAAFIGAALLLAGAVLTAIGTRRRGRAH